MVNPSTAYIAVRIIVAEVPAWPVVGIPTSERVLETIEAAVLQVHQVAVTIFDEVDNGIPVIPEDTC